ncbi:MAG: hypothetical protein Q4C72_09920, partial [Eubacteriales bacterium]|nr:hypothetical protein [Eubacteriales bacterium]
FVRALDRPDWPERLTALETRALSQNSHTVSLLDGGWNSLLEYNDVLADPKAALSLAIWDFQAPVLQELRRHELLRCHLNTTVYPLAQCDASPYPY